MIKENSGKSRVSLHDVYSAINESEKRINSNLVLINRHLSTLNGKVAEHEALFNILKGKREAAVAENQDMYNKWIPLIGIGLTSLFSTIALVVSLIW